MVLPHKLKRNNTGRNLKVNSQLHDKPTTLCVTSKFDIPSNVIYIS